ncbi:MAG TPA: LLM class flavin-dependent oxidoreductase, partial [Rhodopila sp.]
MLPPLGYLLPTRESIMEGRPQTGPLLTLAERAASLGFASVWVGDSLTARPRHDPLTLLAAVSGRIPNVTIGTAVLLPMLRNPVILAHQIATLDQLAGGNLILGVGFAADRPNIRTEFAAAGVPFEHRIGRMLEGLRLCRALWSGQPVDWEGRWQTTQAVIGPTPARPGGPLLWIGGNLPASLDRAGKFFDGWFPIAPTAADFATG